MIRRTLQRYAAHIYIGGGLAFVVGAVVALWAASTAGAVIGSVLVTTGLAAMGTTSRSVGA